MQSASKKVMAAIVILVAIGAMTYVATKGKPELPSAPSSSNSSSDSPALWQPIANAPWHYALRIPAAFSLTNKADDASVLRYAQDGMSVEIFAEPATSLSTYLSSVDAIRATAYEGQPSVDVQAKREVTVDGLPAKEREVFLNAAGFPAMETIVWRAGTAYVFSTLFENATEITDAGRQLHRDMLSTLQFDS
ncbi:MAG: hypothetical protein PHS73_01130 [Candidatus Peribacteraceae bacterium]|nr:hypothetical protein [Candidatus Peribacteraceae bacterium]